MCDNLENNEPGMYEIYIHKAVNTAGAIFFSAWWLFMAYMILSSRKDGLASHVIAYGFLVFASCLVAYAISQAVGSKFLVKKDGTVTRYSTIAKPRTYHIDEITKVVVHSARGGTSYRIYIGKKRAFELANGMVNYNLLIETLREKGVPFKHSIF